MNWENTCQLLKLLIQYTTPQRGPWARTVEIDSPCLAFISPHSTSSQGLHLVVYGNNKRKLNEGEREAYLRS